MTRDETIEAIRVMQAYVDGKEVEVLYPFSQSQIATTPVWNWDANKYRIKPTAKLRPWTADEVPLGALMRSKHNHQDRMLIHWVNAQVNRELWLDKNEHSTDGGKTWLPCGVVEEAK
jgi:hypothetical protein